ncbi:GNAT family N-acetyltransferase [Undibacterium pigrum]|uniref:GNAT family N-acetyltransferase n=1 Tax=Undibacterium pigrum TaxID=401470 RepID=UPI0014762A3B|nr:GNAT family N-acetyltransferase [Undibacterium pigrum]
MTIIRKACEQDADALQAIYRECVITAAWQQRAADTIPDFAQVSRGETVWLAVDDNDNARAVLAVQEAGAYIHHLYVAPDMQGRGLGKALLQHLQTCIPFPWRLKCVAKNHVALGFYEHLGWHQIEQGQGEDGIYYLLEHTGPI